MADLKALLQEFQADYVEKAKVKFKDRWANIPDEVKRAIEFTSREGAKAAAEVAAGGNPDENPLKEKILILKANAKDIEVMAKIEFRTFLDEMLSDAARIGGSLFRKFIKGVVGI